MPEAAKEKRRLTNLSRYGRTCPGRQFAKGQSPWNSGKSGYHFANMPAESKALKNARIGIKARLRGRLSESHRKKLSLAHIGLVPAMKGRKTGKHSWNWDPSKPTKICAACGKSFCVNRARERTAKYCSNRCHNVSIIHPVQDTSIEKALQAGLSSRGIKFARQYAIMSLTRADLAIPDKRVAIFADGDYWHSRPGAPERDVLITMMLSANGWKVLRFWEHQIRANVKSCVDQIETELRS